MTKAILTKCKLSGLNVVAPDYPSKVTDDISLFDNDPAKLERAIKILGYGTRHVAPDNCTSLDLARVAAERLINDMSLDLSKIDALIGVFQKPDYPFPGSTFILHRDLKLPKSCAVFDVNQGCPGFVYGLWIAGSLIEGGGCRKILLVAGDSHPQPQPQYKTKNTLIFGSAGSAALLEYNSQATPVYFNMEAAGTYYDSIVSPAAGAKLPIKDDISKLSYKTPDGEIHNFTDSYVDWLTVFNFSIKEVAPNIIDLLFFAGLTISDIDFFAIHQANKQIVDRIAAKAGIPKQQYSTLTFSEFANQSTVSVPGVITHQLSDKVSNSHLRVMLTGYGLGAAWASSIMELDHIYCPPPILVKFNNLRSRKEEIDYWVNKFEDSNQ